MDQIQTHPYNAAQAKTFIAPGSLSFPGGAGELTPPSSETDKQNIQRQVNGSQQGFQVPNGNGGDSRYSCCDTWCDSRRQWYCSYLAVCITHELHLSNVKLILHVKKHRCHGQSRLPLGPKDDRPACEKC